jgi:hypothetical protein
MLSPVRNILENAAKIEYFRTALANQNLVHKEIKTRLNFTDIGTIWFTQICLPFTYIKLTYIKL